MIRGPCDAAVEKGADVNAPGVIMAPCTAAASVEVMRNVKDAAGEVCRCQCTGRREKMAMQTASSIARGHEGRWCKLLLEKVQIVNATGEDIRQCTARQHQLEGGGGGHEGI